MSRQLMNLPINIPWCQIAVSSDMMDTRFGDRHFPAPWRSSIAISAYEPKLEDLPEEFSGLRITYLKITTTITGYQPTRDETNQGIADLDDESSTQFRLLFEEYLACYGALLNIAVFPAKLLPGGLLQIADENLENYPHIVSFEPKTRDLYQAASESSEILTASNSRFATDKTLTQTETTESSFTVEIPIIEPKSGKKIGGISSSKSRSDMDQESWNVQTDASRNRRETQGTTTQLSQMYNLLTGYHQGTNRAAFLMLARPHVLQATSRRTFVQGLREMEGVTEELLIVSRPAEIEVLCIEASLETGHYHEDVQLIQPKEKYETNVIERTLGPISVSSRLRFRRTKAFEHVFPNLEFDGFEFDPRNGVGAVDQERLPDDNAVGMTGGGWWYSELPALIRNEYETQSPGALAVSGEIRSFVGDSTTFHRTYKIHLRKPLSIEGEPRTDIGDLLITRRGLEVCIKAGVNCPEIVTDPRPSAPEDTVLESIVDERKLRVPPALFTREAMGESPLPASKVLLKQIRDQMISSWRQPSRYPADEVSFIGSNYFKSRALKLLPQKRLEIPLGEIQGIPSAVVKSFGENCTLAQALETDLAGFARKTGLSIKQSIKARIDLLGLKSTFNESGDDTAPESDQE